MREQKAKRLVILDCNSIIHRAFHALPELTTPRGEVVNAVYGFLLVFFRVIKEFRPGYIAAAYDYPAPSFREKISKEYKAKRPPAPQVLYDQIPKTKKFLEAFGVPIFEKEGFEADDLIGTIAKLAKRQQVMPATETIIVSGDADLLQLTDEHTKVYLLKRGVKDVVLYGEKEVREKYGGLTPNQIVDFKALRGDPSDNIPGVTGIGEKTATELLLEFGGLENLYKEIEENSERAKKIKPKIKELLIKYKGQAFISKSLAQIKGDVPIDFKLNQCGREGFSKNLATQALSELNFSSLINRLSEISP